MGLVHWVMTGAAPDDYAFELTAETFSDKPVARLRSVTTPAPAFGAFCQCIAAAAYLGKRIRLSASLQLSGVSGWAGLWLRVDGPHARETLGFDNMRDQGLTGTVGWQRYAVVLDVDRRADAIVFGALLVGEGDLRVADFAFDEVGVDVPVTGAGFVVPAHPSNLDFTEPDPSLDASHGSEP